MYVTAVESTTLVTVAYDKACKLLQLEFGSRAIYQYFGVAAAVHEGLLGAPSKGSYFNRFIRGRFPYSQISHEPGGVRPGSLSQNADDRGLPWRGR
jgi:KTSC domain